MATSEAISVNCECGAHHEPGHIVIAAVQDLPFRPGGFMVDSEGFCFKGKGELQYLHRYVPERFVFLQFVLNDVKTWLRTGKVQQIAIGNALN